MADSAIALTVLIPVFNEAGNAAPLAYEVAEALDGVAPFEVIFVDDGSSDETSVELAVVQARLPNVRVIRHDRRAGKSAALMTGFRAARGQWIQTLDGDGQNDPNDAAALWKTLTRRRPRRGSGSWPASASGATTAR